MKEKDNFAIPFQVQNLIDTMMNKNEKEHIRENYKMRLIVIRDTIDDAIHFYNMENQVVSSNVKGKKK